MIIALFFIFHAHTIYILCIYILYAVFHSCQKTAVSPQIPVIFVVSAAGSSRFCPHD